MLVSNHVKMRWYYTNVKKYTDLGYKFTNYGETFDCKVEDLPENSQYRIEVACDECNKRCTLNFSTYTRTNEYIEHGLGSYLCRSCAHIKRLGYDDEKFKSKVYELVKDEYRILGKYFGNKVKVEFEHLKCGFRFTMRPNNFFSGNRCPSCAGTLRSDTDIFIKQVKDIVGSEYTVLGEYINNKTKINMVHNSCLYNFKIIPNNFLRGARCPSCFGNVKKTTDDFRSELQNMYDNEYEVLGEYVNSHTPIKMMHNECKRLISMTPNSILGGARCVHCAYISKGLKSRKTHNEFYKDFQLIANNEYELLSTYIRSTDKVSICHKKCGEIFEITPNAFLRGIGCSYCKLSKGEKIVEQFLKSNKIKYKRQVGFLGCKFVNKLRFDFGIYDENDALIMLIEYDGELHYIPVDYFGGEKGLRRQQQRDMAKNEYCKENNIHLIRIPYWEKGNIEYILKDLFINKYI